MASILRSGTFVAAVMAVVMLMAVVVPITISMSDLGESPYYEENEIGSGDYRMSYSKTAPTLVVRSVAGGNDTQRITLKVGASPAQQIEGNKVIIGDTFVLTLSPSSAKILWTSKTPTDDGDDPLDPNSKGETKASTEHLHQWVVGDVLTIRGSAWNMSYTVSGESKLTTNNYTWIAYPDAEGSYLHTNAPAFVDTGSVIIAGGATLGDEARAVLRGTLEDMKVIFSYYSHADTAVVNWSTGEYTNVLDGMTVDLTVGGSTRTIEITDFIVPLEYKAGFEKGVASLLVALLPVLLAVAIILGVVAVYVLKTARDGREW